MKYTIPEFASEIRKYYPGDYDDLTDDILVNLWLKKYPNDSNKVDLTPQQNTVIPKKDTVVTPNQPSNNDFPPCAIKWGKVQKTPKGIDVIVFKTTTLDQPYIQLFSKNGRFMVLGGTHKGKMGNYRCTEEGNLWLKLDEELKKEPSKLIDVTITLNDILSGKGLVKKGMRGPVVGEIQDILIKLGYVNVSKNNKSDSIFGSRTKQMVKKFQSDKKLSDDGIVGPITLKLMTELTKKSEYSGMGDDSPEFLQAQLDAQKSQLPLNHGKEEINDDGSIYKFDGYSGRYIPEYDYFNLYNNDGTKKLQENIVKNIVLKNLHSLL